MFEKFLRKDNELVVSQQDNSRLWRITAQQLQRVQNGHGYAIAITDHFTVKAVTAAGAVGIFKMRQDGMKWYVIDVSPEQIMDASAQT